MGTAAETAIGVPRTGLRCRKRPNVNKKAVPSKKDYDLRHRVIRVGGRWP